MNVKALFDKSIWALFMASNKEFFKANKGFFKAEDEEHKLKTKICMKEKHASVHTQHTFHFPSVFITNTDVKENHYQKIIIIPKA